MSLPPRIRVFPDTSDLIHARIVDALHRAGFRADAQAEDRWVPLSEKPKAARVFHMRTMADRLIRTTDRARTEEARAILRDASLDLMDLARREAP